MKGRVKSFIPDKGYGFLLGDDGRSYFFHSSDLESSELASRVIDGQLVEFEASATPKGYRARKCKLLRLSGEQALTLPTKFLTSKTKAVAGWEIAEAADWLIVTSSRDSPDDARIQIEDLANRIGANAAIEISYSKSRGAERGRGRGVHYFTVHHFTARPVFVVRGTSLIGAPGAEMPRLNERAASLKEDLVEKTKRNEKSLGSISNAVLAIAAIFAVLSFMSGSEEVAGFGAAVGFIVWLRIRVTPTSCDDWLVQSKYSP